MIKINLIPYRQQRKIRQFAKQILTGVIAVIPVLIVVFFLGSSLNSEIGDADKEISRLNSEIQKNREQMRQIQVFKRKKEVLQTKMDIVGNLEKDRSNPIYLLTEIARSMPGRLWLTSVNQKSAKLELQGRALDNIAISDYMIKLAESDIFHNVDLKEIKTETRQVQPGVQLKNFIITCDIRFDTKKKG